MSDTLFKQAFDLRRDKDYRGAVKIYRSLWDENPSDFDEWRGWSYAFCLKELKLYDEALDICRYIYPKNKQSKYIQNLYAQCIYYTQIKASSIPPLDVIRKAVKAMVSLSPPHQEYSLSAKAVFFLCKQLMKQPNIPWTEIESWLNLMDPDLLSKSVFQSKSSGGKMVEFASEQEEWYSIMIRVKGGLNQPEEMLKLLGETNKRNIRWHYQNDIWFKRKEAFAHRQLGNLKEAERLLHEILRKKQDWFIYSDLGDVLEPKPEKLEAYSKAALAGGELKMKIDLFKRMADLIKGDKGYIETYQDLLLLMARIRLENGWSLPEELEQQLEQEQIDLGSVNSAKEAFDKVLNFCKNTIGHEEKFIGKVKLIHGNGLSGIIRGDNGKEYFFSMKTFSQKGINVVIGMPVQFGLIDSFDKKRQVATKMATDIRLLTI